MNKYKSNDYRCLKLELYPKYCFIADKYLYDIGLNNAEVMKIYTDSIMPIENYTFGLYRLPECLVTSTVIPEQISALDKRLDSPILFNNSEELYINNLVEDLKQEYDDLNDRLLYFFLLERVSKGELHMVEGGKNLVAFIDKTTNRNFTIKKPCN
jgi:hypothetical protein